MKFRTVLLVIVLALVGQAAAEDIDACGTLSVDGATYTLNQSVSSTGTCFIIGANNITLTSDSQLNQINFSTATGGYGINNTEYSNVTIKNLNITTINTSSSSYNIYYNGANAKFGNITNNTVISTSGYGIYLLSSSDNTLTNNTLSATSGRGISLYESSNNNLTNNTASATTGNVIYLISSSNNNLANNSITATSGRGILLLSSSNNNLTNNNVIVTDGYGIFLSASSNNILTNNIATATSGIGIYLLSSSDNNIAGGSIYSTSGSSYYLRSSYNNTFTNTNFTSRKIYFYTANTVWFNYSNGTGLPYVANNVSAAETIDRTLYNWTQTNITFSDKIDATTVTSYYNITGLLPSEPYDVWVDTNLNYSVTTDAGGQLPLFSVLLTTTSQTIKVLNEAPFTKVTWLWWE